MLDSDHLAVKDFHRGWVSIDLSAGGVLVCDIDGTVADASHRLHHIQTTPKDWDGFFAKIEDDVPRADIVEAVRRIAGHPDWKVVLCSGRKQSLARATRRWLAKHGVPFDALYLRRENDRRHDDVVKRDLLKVMISHGYTPTLSFEDRSRVVAMWRGEGIETIQVAEGDF